MRGKGEGSIYQDTRGLWRASIELPSPDGRRRRKVVSAKTKRALLAKMAAAREALAEHGDLPTDTMPVGTWFTYWLETIAARELRPKSLGNYRSLTKNHIIPTIGKVPLEKLAPSHIRKVYDVMLAKGLSTTSALAVYAVLSSGLTAAEREGRIRRNPTQLVKAPRRATTSLETLSIDDAVRLVDQFGRSPDAYLWATFLLTGARRGEVLGLQWSRIDSGIDLSWQLQRHQPGMTPPADYEHQHLQNGLYLTRPKTRAGVRRLPLMEPLRGILVAWRQLAPENRHDLVFTWDDGRPIDPDWATRTWPKVLAAAGIEKDVRLHDIRHSTIDILLELGVAIDVIRDAYGHTRVEQSLAYRSPARLVRLEREFQPFSDLFTMPKTGTHPAIGA
jgi:integrase